MSIGLFRLRNEVEAKAVHKLIVLRSAEICILINSRLTETKTGCHQPVVDGSQEGMILYQL